MDTIKKAPPRYNMSQKIRIYISLRAAGYTIKEVADLMGLPLRIAWRMERATRAAIVLESDFLQLKKICTHEKENIPHN